MFETQDTASFSETSLPEQDYLARILGYSVAVITVLIGIIIDYYPNEALVVVIIALAYPHVIHATSKPFRKKHAYTTRQFLIHVDAILCGLMLAYLHLPIELVVLFLIMINTSFIIVGSITAWAFCVIEAVI